MSRPKGSRPVGLALRLLALVGVAIVGYVMVVTERVHDTERIDEAGVALIGLCMFGVLMVCYNAWQRGGLHFALAKSGGVPPGMAVQRPTAPSATQRRGPSGDDAIVVDDITVTFGLRTAVSGLSMHVGKGEIVGLLGPNGAGKTTTVDVCVGLRKPDSGRALILGSDVTTGGAAMRRKIGVVPQESGLYGELTGFEHMRLFASLYDLPSTSTRIEEVLRLIGLWDRRNSRVEGYSGGMKRRLALARALLHDPPVFFLDEPTLGVDVHGRRALWDHIIELRNQGRSVLLTTNYLEEATALCDRVVIIDHGQVIADERPDTLRRQSGTTLILETPGDPQGVARAIDEACGVESKVVEGFVRVPLARDELAAKAIEAAGAVAPVVGVRTEEPSLEEVFLRLTGRGLRE